MAESAVVGDLVEQRFADRRDRIAVHEHQEVVRGVDLVAEAFVVVRGELVESAIVGQDVVDVTVLGRGVQVRVVLVG